MTKSTNRRRWLLAAAAAPWAGRLAAQSAWPTRAVRFIVPFSAGGSTDVVARMLGQKLTAGWGQAVVVENRTGAGGTIGADLVAKAAPDGYTLLLASGSITIAPNLYPGMPFDTKKDLLPVINVAGGPMLVVVRDASPYRTLKDLLDAARAAPGRLTFGSAGVGSQVHMAGERFAHAASIDIAHVPYKGEALAYTDLIGGQVQLVVGNFAAASALIAPGRLRALAVSSHARMPQQPDVPTAREAGLADFEMSSWFGLLAPGGTPAAIAEKLHDDTAKALADTEIKARLYVQGMTPVGGSSEAFVKQIDEELARWAQVVAARKLKLS